LRSEIRNAVQTHLAGTQSFLCDLLRFPSTSGEETEAMEFIADSFSSLGTVEKVPLSNDLLSDPDYSSPIPGLTYDGRSNVRVRRDGGGGRSLLLNAHMDVVPPSEGMTDPWTGRVEDGTVYGRGACDAKGQAAAAFLALSALNDVGTPGNVTVHFVVEEENGGNGTLAMIRGNDRADGCIVMEPTDGVVFTSIRGAVWFRLTLHGRAGHSGQAGETKSALLMARDAIGILEEYHASLLAASRGLELFDPYPNPMPLTAGKLNAGRWPASAPSEAVLEGVLGFLPNKTKEEVAGEMKNALVDGDLSPEEFDLVMTYMHDCSVLAPRHDLPQGLLASAEDAGTPLEIGAMTASCDAWFYNNILGIPTVVYGPGTLKVAHSKDEHIRMADIATAAKVLAGFISDWGKE